MPEILNGVITTENLNAFTKWFSWISIQLTNLFIWIFSQFGLEVTARFAGTLTLIAEVIVLFLVIKYLAVPILKVALIIILAIAIIGLFSPAW